MASCRINQQTCNRRYPKLDCLKVRGKKLSGADRRKPAKRYSGPSQKEDDIRRMRYRAAGAELQTLLHVLKAMLYRVGRIAGGMLYRVGGIA